MKKTILLCLLTVSVTLAKAQITPSVTIPNPIPEFNGTYEDFGKHHFFYPNQNETRYATDSRPSAIKVVKYYTKHAYPHQYLLANNNISFVFTKRVVVAGGSNTDSLHRVDLEMERSNTSAFLARVDTQNIGILNYFDEWYGATGRTDVRGGASIAVQSIYPNIDMVYTSNNTGLKIYYIVYPGGDPNQIILKLNGSKSNYISGNDLVAEANWSSIKFVKPKMYQYTLINNVVTPVNVCPASWQSAGTDRYQVTTAASWNPFLPLVIQVSQGPATQLNINSLKWSTYFGGGNMDYILRTNSDANNNLFAAGWTISSDFPQAPGATPVQAVNFAYDAFLSKFDAAGILKWSTYFGGSSSEQIKDIDFKSGDVWCVGWTSSFNLPVQNKSNAFNDATFAGGNDDGFIFQVDASTGGTNKWSTYFGGNLGDHFRGCKFDSNGNFFVVGGSNSTNLTTNGPSGSYQQTYNSSQQVLPPFLNPDVCDAIILKFDASNSALNWFTFFGTDVGGTNSANDFNDEFWDLDIDGTDVYACGSAGGTNLPSSVNSKMLSGSYYDGILAKFTTSGALTASKYTNGNVKNYSVRVFNSKVYCCGISKNGATNVNSGNYFYDNTCATGDFDACFSVHSLNLSTTIHNTFLGGTGTDEALEMQFSPNGVFYLAGHTYASGFPITSIANTYNSGYSGNLEYFIAAFQEGNSNIVWSTCLGSPNDESDQSWEATSISLDGQNFLHLGGCSNSYNTFPLDNNGGVPYFQPQRSGGPLGFATDATITRFDLVPLNTYVGIEDFKGTSFSFGLYPNPTTQYLTIDNAELVNQNLHYAVYNTKGQKLIEGIFNSTNQKNIDVSNLQQGVYFINVGNGTRTFSNKFIKTTE
jgi:hypothetical protein